MGNWGCNTIGSSCGRIITTFAAFTAFTTHFAFARAFAATTTATATGRGAVVIMAAIVIVVAVVVVVVTIFTLAAHFGFTATAATTLWRPRHRGNLKISSKTHLLPCCYQVLPISSLNGAACQQKKGKKQQQGCNLCASG